MVNDHASSVVGPHELLKMPDALEGCSANPQLSLSNSESPLVSSPTPHSEISSGSLLHKIGV